MYGKSLTWMGCGGSRIEVGSNKELEQVTRVAENNYGETGGSRLKAE